MASPKQTTQDRAGFGNSIHLLNRSTPPLDCGPSVNEVHTTSGDEKKVGDQANVPFTVESEEWVEGETSERPSVIPMHDSRTIIFLIPPVVCYAVIRSFTEWYDEIGLLSDLAKDSLQFIAGSGCLIMMFYVTRHLREQRLINIWCYLAAGSFMLGRVFDIANEIESLDHIFLIGKESTLNISVKSTFSALAVCLLLLIVQSLALGIAQSEERFRKLAESTPVATAIFHGKKVVYANSFAEQIFGLNQTRDWSLLSEAILTKEERDSLQSMANEVYRGGSGIASRVKKCVVEIKSNERNARWMGVSVSGIEYEESPAILFTAHDVTDLKHAEKIEAERQMELLYVQKLEAQRVLAGGVAHRFNTLLTRISANLSLLEEDLGSNSTVTREIQVIENAVNEAAILSKEMISYSGNGRFRVEPLNLSNLIEQSREFLETAIQEKALIVYDLSPDLPAVKCDVNEIRHLLCNLVTNASEALGDDVGTIVVSTGVYQRRKLEWTQNECGSSLQDPYVFLSVSDTGIGMEMGEVEKIFEPFCSTKGVGRGLGLAAVQGIVHGHGGVIEVDSCPDQGSTFKVCLPAVATSRDIGTNVNLAAEVV